MGCVFYRKTDEVCEFTLNQKCKKAKCIEWREGIDFEDCEQCGFTVQTMLIDGKKICCSCGGGF